jgi:hypothetical protein
MKLKLTLFFLILSFLNYSQNNIPQTIDHPEKIFPDLYQVKISFVEPKIQSIGEKELYLKKGKLKGYSDIRNEYNSTFEITFRDNSVFKGRVYSNYGGHENTYSIGYGTMNFSNGDVFIGNFYKGYPVSGKYTYSNGDKAEIKSLNYNGNSMDYSGTAVIKEFFLKNGDRFLVNDNDQVFEYKTATGMFLKSKREPDNSISGYTNYWTKEGNTYYGEIKNNRPVGRWKVTDSNGTYVVVFGDAGISGYIPLKIENKLIWGQYEKGRLLKTVKYLAPKTFCINGDCINGESNLFIYNEPESGSDCVLKGDFKNGMPTGDFTTLINAENGMPKYIISGPLKDYKFNGKCNKIWQNKEVTFTGEYANGLPVSGSLIANGNIIQVTKFVENKIIAKQTFPKTANTRYRYYEGEFDEEGNVKGHGVVYFEDGRKIEGSNWIRNYCGDCSVYTKTNGWIDHRSYNLLSDVLLWSIADPTFIKNDIQSAQEANIQQSANEHICGRCNGQGVIKVKCPICHGLGYRKDMVAIDKTTGNATHLATCTYCYGTGLYPVTTCSGCNGRGLVKN